MEIAFERFWVIDVEGSGGTPPEIVELAMIEVANLALTGRQKHWLVHPQHPILPSAARIHGLTDDDVADAPTIDDIGDEIMTWTNEAVIVGHNVKVELDIISRSICDWKPVAAIDTLKLARKLKPGLESYSLEKLGGVTGHAVEAGRLSGKRHHSALYDAILTALIFIDLISSLAPGLRSEALMNANLLDGRQGTLL